MGWGAEDIGGEDRFDSHNFTKICMKLEFYRHSQCVVIMFIVLFYSIINAKHKTCKNLSKIMFYAPSSIPPPASFLDYVVN